MSKAAAILLTELTVEIEFENPPKVARKTIAVPTAHIHSINASYLIIEPASKDSGGQQQECTKVGGMYFLYDVAESPRRIAQLMNQDDAADSLDKLIKLVEEAPIWGGISK